MTTYLDVEEEHKKKQDELDEAKLTAKFWQNAFFELVTRIARFVPEAKINPTEYLLECEETLERELSNVRRTG